MMTWIKRQWDVYRWPIICVIAVLFGLAVVFGTDLLAALRDKLSDADWWVDNLIAVILFPAITAFLVSITQRAYERQQRKPYEGWKWKVTWAVGDTRFYDIHWEDAERYWQSQFEMWRAVKSIAGNSGRIVITHVDEAIKRGWLIDPARSQAGETDGDKTYVIDFTEMGDHFSARTT